MSDDLTEQICLNRGDSDDLGESTGFIEPGSGDLGESVRFKEHDSDNHAESVRNVFESDDPLEPTRLNEQNKNDPRETMNLNRYFSDLEYCKKAQVRRDGIFTTSAVGLVELSNVVYSKLCEVSPRFGKRVSPSMFMYYASQLHYTRLCILEWEANKSDDEDMRTMNNNNLSKRWIIPQLLADYFNTIGSFRDSAGLLVKHHEIVFPWADDIEGINGYFGRVDSFTHAHYENRISPGVAAKRIVEDLIFTLHPFGKQREGLWNLPRSLAPAERNAGGPTGNLLGWSLAAALTPEQVFVLKDCGVSIGQGKIVFSHCTRFCHNDKLMSYISAQLNELRGRVKCVEQLSTDPMGSVAQHDFQLVGPHGGIPRNYVYGDLSTYNCGFLPLHMFQELHAHVFRLRTMKRKMVLADDLTVNPWCCYTFKTYTEVPESWCKTCNIYFIFGQLKVWDVGWYRSQIADLRPLLNGLMDKTLVQ